MSESNIRVPKPQSDGQSGHNGCCAGIRETLSMVGDKWSMLVVKILSDEPLRFNELLRRVEGISQRMLTRTLRELERDGLLTRTVTPTKPPSVEYALTDLGYTLLEPVNALVQWTFAHYPKISESQRRFDKRLPFALTYKR